MTSKHFIAWVERQGQYLRNKLALNAIDPLDPYLLAKKFGAVVLSPQEVPAFTQDIIHQLLVADPNGWSAGSISMPNGKVVILMNPTHALTRRRATLMEELAHLHLKHKPSGLILIGGLVATRIYKKTHETQAYWVGAAALVTSTMLRHAQSNRISKRILAQRCGVSSDLVAFRENVTGIRLY